MQIIRPLILLLPTASTLASALPLPQHPSKPPQQPPAESKRESSANPVTKAAETVGYVSLGGAGIYAASRIGKKPWTDQDRKDCWDRWERNFHLTFGDEARPSDALMDLWEWRCNSVETAELSEAARLEELADHRGFFHRGQPAPAHPRPAHAPLPASRRPKKSVFGAGPAPEYDPAPVLGAIAAAGSLPFVGGAVQGVGKAFGVARTLAAGGGAGGGF